MHAANQLDPKELTMSEQMRKEFEAWAGGPAIGLDISRETLQPRPYQDYTTAWAWDAWQAALATQPQAPQGDVMELALEALDDDSPYGRFLAQRLLRDALAGTIACPACKGQGGGEEWIANENDRSGQSDYRAWVDCTLCNTNTPSTGGAQMDAKRLDWLSTEVGTVRRDTMGGLVPSYINWGNGVTLRQAIDAAISAQPQTSVAPQKSGVGITKLMEASREAIYSITNIRDIELPTPTETPEAGK
jgi:hypothetical protein